MLPQQKPSYRPDIDGLRAVAVLGVLFFHAGLGFPGGYVGVDVFFVISGFLITSIIMKDLRKGTFSIIHFWGKRIRRILPAVAFAVLAIMVAGWFFLIPRDYEVLGKQVIALIAFSSNIKLWKETGYFANAAEEKPMLHTWSLSVEEQFYLILPILLVLVYKIRRGRWVFPSLLAVVVSSFLLSVVASYRAPSANFFLLPTRAWELGIGSLLAFVPAIRSRRIAEGMALLGLCAILFAYFAYRADTRFPGLSALPPVLGAALMIWAGCRSTLAHSGGANAPAGSASASHINRNEEHPALAPSALPIVNRLLSIRPVVFIGLISYSLYLWHWPIFAFQKYLGFQGGNVSTQIALALASIPPAWVSWRFIEKPFRIQKNLPTEWHVYGFGAVGTALMLVPACFLWASRGAADERLSPVQLKIADGANDFAFINELGLSDIPTNLVEIGLKMGDPKVFVWGDSHAMAILPAIDIVCKELGVSGKAATHSSTAPVLHWFARTEFGLNEAAPAWNDKILSYLSDCANTAEKEQVVLILAARWSSYTDKDGFADALKRTVTTLKEDGVKIVMFEEVPRFHFDPPRALTLASLGVQGTSKNPSIFGNFC